MIPFSILDLAPIPEGGSATETFRHSLELAQNAERWGYKRFWLAEHHNMTGIASAATAVVIGHVAGGTRTIRVGSGGIMLPNHAPLTIAEQFGTLASLYPDRIDLGLGRAPGTDQRTAHALRRTLEGTSDDFPQDVMELQGYLGPLKPGQAVQAVPGTNTNVPLWILGSSLYGAQLAAALGLPYAFASHFAPDAMTQALQVYRSTFRPSAQLERPYAMVALNLFAADTDAEGQRLFTSLQQQFIRLRRGTPGQLPRPVDSMEGIWSPGERAGVEQALSCSVIGSKQSIRRGIEQFIERVQPDELILTAMMYDQRARLRSFEIGAEIHAELYGAAAAAPRAEALT
jgi:luciferase family oxidoreductase group 1